MQNVTKWKEKRIDVNCQFWWNSRASSKIDNFRLHVDPNALQRKQRRQPNQTKRNQTKKKKIENGNTRVQVRV